MLVVIFEVGMSRGYLAAEISRAKVHGGVLTASFSGRYLAN